MNTTHFHLTTAVIGLIFMALGVVFLLDQLDVFSLNARYIVPAFVIGLGLAIMAGSLSRGSKQPS